MPVKHSKYRAPLLFFHPHLETIFPAVLRQVYFDKFSRERIETDDADFLDLDWFENGNAELIILCHGLEGNSKRPYMKGMSKAFALNGYDVLSWNYRGCSGELNRKPRFYHSGATDDLDAIVRHVTKNGNYKRIGLIGFSLGGNLVLKYLGEEWDSKQIVKAGMAISVPVDLAASSVEINKMVNRLYSNSFLRSLSKKVKGKAKMFPDLIDISSLKGIQSMRDFDEVYTAPVHGFVDASDYYSTCSSLYFLENIELPTLILNAKNDTFLSPSCFPEDLLRHHKYVELQITDKGGHVGYSSRFAMGQYWSEKVALDFMMSK